MFIECADLYQMRYVGLLFGFSFSGIEMIIRESWCG